LGRKKKNVKEEEENTERQTRKLINVEKRVYEELTKVKGYLMEQSGRKVTYSDALEVCVVAFNVMMRAIENGEAYIEDATGKRGVIIFRRIEEEEEQKQKSDDLIKKAQLN